MHYNQLNYYRANPFAGQGYLPDIALFNRKQKQCPSQIPVGDEFFVDSGRKHFRDKFNRSEIQNNNILSSPQRYPFQHRIALDKVYSRNLDTIDIEGASSSTRVSQSIKNKYKAKEELARKNGISLNQQQQEKDMVYEVKRRQIALKQYQQAKNKQKHANQQERPQNKEKQQPNTTILRRAGDMRQPGGVSLQYKKYIMRNSSNKYHKIAPLAQYQQLTQSHQPQPYRQRANSLNHPGISHNQSNYNQSNYNQNNINTPPNHQSITANSHNYAADHSHLQPRLSPQIEKEEYLRQTLSVNNRYKSNPQYISNYQIELNRRKEQNSKTVEYQEKLKNRYYDRKQLRRSNPTNLSSSFNMAAQSIVGNQ